MKSLNKFLKIVNRVIAEGRAQSGKRKNAMRHALCPMRRRIGC